MALKMAMAASSAPGAFSSRRAMAICMKARSASGVSGKRLTSALQVSTAFLRSFLTRKRFHLVS